MHFNLAVANVILKWLVVGCQQTKLLLCYSAHSPLKVSSDLQPLGQTTGQGRGEANTKPTKLVVNTKASKENQN